MDNLLINLSQAIATLVAVILAFLLSILSDRSSWKHRKKEQIREHQIASLKELTSLLQNVENTLRYIVEYKKDVLLAVNNAASNAIRQTRIEDGNANLNEQFLLLQDLKGKVKQEYLELKLLRYNPNQLRLIDECCSELERLNVWFQQMDSPVTDSRIDIQCVDGVISLFASFIEVAENGLTK